MRRGVVVEQGPTATVFAAPQADYTKALLEAEPTGEKAPPPPGAPVVLEGRDVDLVFSSGGGCGRGIAAGRARGRLGERPAAARRNAGHRRRVRPGKSTLARALLAPAAGLRHRECEGRRHRDISARQCAALRPLRKRLQIVLQDPFGSLSPRMTAGEIVSEGLLVHAPEMSRADRDRAAAHAFEEVALDPAWRKTRYPHEFSGGQRQRIAIARAMILKAGRRRAGRADLPALDRQCRSRSSISCGIFRRGTILRTCSSATT